MKHPGLILLLAAILLAPAAARVGESEAALKEVFGKAPDPKSPKGMAVWFIETRNGPLVYTVTLNAEGHSIAEGIKPLKQAVLTAAMAQDFIQNQIAPFRDSKTARVVPAGEKYTFGGQAFTCAEHEFVLLDEANDLLIIWSRGGIATIIAVNREMVQRTGG